MEQVDLNHIKTCPVCEKGSFKKELLCRDYTVSQAQFQIVSCDQCDFWFTNPIPPENEIGRYYKSEDYISHSSTKKGLFNKAYHWVRKRAIDKKERLISSLSSGKNLVDVGCGTGDFLKHCSEKNWNAIGLEPDDDARNFARDQNKVDARPISELYELEEGSVDIITMWHVLEHVYDLNKDIEQILKLLKPEGKLVVAVPNRESYDAKYYKEFWAAYDVPRHLYHFTEKDIDKLFEKYNAKREQTIPMKWDAYYVSMLSSSYKGKSKISGLFRGWVSNIKAKNNTYSSSIYIISKK